MFWMIPFQVDCLQVGLPDSETPGGTGYLGKEERAEGKEAWNAGKESVREGGREVGGGDRGEVPWL